MCVTDHLSLYCFLEPLDHPGSSAIEARADMVSVAWESAIEDWEGDTKGRARLDMSTFSDSVFELATCYAEELTVNGFVRFLKQLHGGTTIAEDDDGDGAAQLSRSGSRGARPKSRGGGQRRWRQTYPLERDRQAVGANADKVRAVLRDIASAGVEAWVAQHGGQAPCFASGGDSTTTTTCVGTPADLMAALMVSADEAHGAGNKSAEARLREVLSWISPADAHHELKDDVARGRLISLFRALDAGSQDGRLSATDFAASTQPGTASTSKPRGLRSAGALVAAFGGSWKRKA